MAMSGLQQQHAWDSQWQLDGRCHVLFHKQTVLDVRATEGWVEEKWEDAGDGTLILKRIRHAGAGRPIYREADYIRIFTPGDATNIVDKEVTQHHRDEYPKEWEAYKLGAEQPVHGTPLEVWPAFPRSLAEELKFFKVRTVEDLASMADVHCQKVSGLVSWKQKARDWLQAAQTQAPIAEMRAEITQRDTEIEELKRQVAEMKALMESATKPTTPPHDAKGQPARKP